MTAQCPHMPCYSPQLTCYRSEHVMTIPIMTSIFQNQLNFSGHLYILDKVAKSKQTMKLRIVVHLAVLVAEYVKQMCYLLFSVRSNETYLW